MKGLVKGKEVRKSWDGWIEIEFDNVISRAEYKKNVSNRPLGKERDREERGIASRLNKGSYGYKPVRCNPDKFTRILKGDIWYSEGFWYYGEGRGEKRGVEILLRNRNGWYG